MEKRMMDKKTNSFIKPLEIIDDNGVPKYVQVFTQLKKELFFNQYNADDRFYSLRDLTSIYNVDHRTIRSAIELLINAGLVYNKPSSGIYVSRKRERLSTLSMGNVWFYQPGESRDHPYYYGILTALQQQAGSYNMNVIVNRQSGLENFKSWFRPESGDGLVVTGEFESDLIDYLREIFDLRYVVVGNYELPTGVPNLHTRVQEAVKKAVLIAADAGRKRIGTITNTKGQLSVRELLAGVEDGCAETNMVVSDFIMDKNENGHKGLEQLIRKDTDTVIVSGTAYAGLCRYIFENKIAFKKDLYVIRYGIGEYSHDFSDIPSLVMHSDKNDHAEKALKTLFWGGPIFSEIEIDISDVTFR